MVIMVLSSSRYQSSSVMTKSKSTIGAYESVIESLQSFINEDNLSSMAYNNGKSYYGSVLVPFVKASILLTEAVSEACQKFVDTYCAEVDSCDLDSDRLERQIDEAKMRIAHLESIRQDIALKDIPDYAKEQQLMYNDKTMNPILSMKKDLEDKLEKLLEFEATSPEIFSNITDLKAIVDKGKAQTDVSWNGGAFVIPKDLSWTNTVTDKWKIRLDEIKAKEDAYHSAKRKELEGYNVYAWVYKDPKTKEVQVMWFIDKDGVRIFDEELQEYVEKYGKDFEGIYEIVGWDKIYELDLAARRRGDGKNYLNENQIPEGWQGYSKVGAYVDSAYWYAQKTGLLDLAMMVGLSYAASKSQMKASTSKNVDNVLDDASTGKKINKLEADFSKMMPPEEAARYNQHWDDLANNVSLEQRLWNQDVLVNAQGALTFGSVADLSNNALNMLDKYENGKWSGNVAGQTQGTRAGGTYNNVNGKLPIADYNGNHITYKEFDINNKVANFSRDAERFVRGSDGSVYYTIDHYKTFIKVK